MNVTITLEAGAIIINGVNLEAILQKVYERGKNDSALESKTEKVTFITLSKELSKDGRTVSARTLTKRAREAHVKLFRFDGNRLACLRKDIRLFLDVGDN